MVSSLIKSFRKSNAEARKSTPGVALPSGMCSQYHASNDHTVVIKFLVSGRSIAAPYCIQI